MDDSIKEITEELPQRPVHRSLDLATLGSIADDQVELAIVDYVDLKLAGRAAGEDDSAFAASLPPGVWALYLTARVETEVINGGFKRYYWSRVGRFAHEAVAAFEFFSAYQHARLLREANRKWAELTATTGLSQGQEQELPGGISPSQQVSALCELEDRFYRLDESLSTLRIAKIRFAPELFCE